MLLFPLLADVHGVRADLHSPDRESSNNSMQHRMRVRMPKRLER